MLIFSGGLCVVSCFSILDVGFHVLLTYDLSVWVPDVSMFSALGMFHCDDSLLGCICCNDILPGYIFFSKF